MSQPDKSFTRKAVESLALKLLIFVAGVAGAAVLGWLAVNSAWIHGVPGYEVALIVAGLFALCGIGLYFTILAIARVPLRNAPAGSFLEPQENWLREAAEHDRVELQNAVHVINCRVVELIEEGNSRVSFEFTIRNGSVFAVTIDPEIKGFITLWDKRLTGARRVSRLPHNLQRGWNDRFTITQELTKANLAEIKEMDAACEEQGYYDFGDLHVTIKGTSPTMDALPARLQFRRVTRRLLKNEFDFG
jgi:hypothetical protein